MRFFRNLTPTLIAAAALSGCNPPPTSSAPAPSETGATFRIYSVLQGADGPDGRTIPVSEVDGQFRYFTDRATGERVSTAMSAIIDESCLSAVSASNGGETGKPVLNFRLTADCTNTFGRFTAKNVGAQMAFVVNGELKTVAVIASPILAGVGYVAGFDSLAEAEAVAASFE